jgi:hypothetical protein
MATSKRSSTDPPNPPFPNYPYLVPTTIIYPQLPNHIGAKFTLPIVEARPPISIMFPPLDMKLAYDLEFDENGDSLDNKYTKPAPSVKPECIKLTNFNNSQKTKIQAVLNLEIFKNAKTIREQCHILAQYLRPDPLHPDFKLREIADILGVNHTASVTHHLNKPFDELLINGRPPLITKQVREFMTKEIETRYNLKDPITLYEILELICDVFNIQIQYETLAKYLRRDPQYRTAIGVPMEEKRIHYSHRQLIEWYKELGEIIKNIPRYFIFNMDETGVDDFVHSHDILVAIP